MSPQRQDGPGRRPKANRAKEVDQVCDAFESAWSAGNLPRIEEYLQKVEEAHRAQLLDELLLAELDMQVCAGREPDRDRLR